MSARENPTDDLPSADTEQCDCCGEPWAWETDRRYGPRMLRLCEGHADEWLRGERELYAEIEAIAGRAMPVSDLFRLARALDAAERGKRSA